MASKKNKKKSGNAAASSATSSISGMNTPESLKPESRIVKKSARTKKLKTTSQVESRNEGGLIQGGKLEEQKSMGEKREEVSQRDQKDKGSLGNLPMKKRKKSNKGKNPILHHGNNEQKRINEKREASKRDKGDGGRFRNLPKKIKNKPKGKKEGSIGGLILMCTAKTKPDCFRYHVMGVLEKKQSHMMGVKHGLKLFLYDFDLKLLYGIYKACSDGGMNLEPAAFGGAYPFQVRFKVQENCSPLPESVFKKAIKENFNKRTNQFKPELTVKQVYELVKLFKNPPTPATATRVEDAYRELYTDHQNGGQEARYHRIPPEYERMESSKRPISPTGLASSDPLFLTEKEYRSFGLQPGRHTYRTAAAPSVPAYNNTYDIDRETVPQLRRHVFTTAAAPIAPAYNYTYDIDRETEHFQMNSKPNDAATNLNPLFLSEKEYRAHGLMAQREHPSTMPPPSEITYVKVPNYGTERNYPPLPRTEVAPLESYYLTRETRGDYYSSYPDNYARNHPGKEVRDGADRLYTAYYHNLGSEPEYRTAGVSSSRHSFAGPSATYR